VTRSVDRFVTDDRHGSRDYLVETYPGLFEICADGSVVAVGHCPEASQGGSRRTSRGSRRRAAGKARIRRPVAGDRRAQ